MLKRSIANAICHPLIGGAIGKIARERMVFDRFVIETSSPLITPRTKALLFWGLYESAELRFLNRYLRTDLDVVELGSSIGVISCAIRTRIHPERKLVCVEADPQLASLTRSNLEANRLSANTSILANAIDYHDQNEWSMSFCAGADNLTGSVGRMTTGVARTEMTTLASVLHDESIDEFALVSDIEGAEAGIILRDPIALRRCVQIIIELHPTTFEGRPVSAYLMRDALISVHGFSLVAAHGPVFVFEKAG